VGDALVRKADDFRSILDLRPVLTGRVVKRRRQAVQVAATTPHGPVEHKLDPRHAAWLPRFDGRASARKLLERRGGLEEGELAALISAAFRYSLIDFDIDAN
jgi:hypothetical protein